jgi:hypothetical protein
MLTDMTFSFPSLDAPNLGRKKELEKTPKSAIERVAHVGRTWQIHEDGE